MTQKIILSEEEQNYIKQELLNKKTCTELRKEFNIGEDAFLRIAHEIMGPKFNFRRKSYLDINYFQNINTPEKAYWLGFMAADGCIVGNELSIQLQSQDKEHLKKFSQAVDGNFTLREIHGTNNFGKEYFHYRISVRCNEFVRDLKKWNIVQNKSLSLQVPELKDDLFPYWIIGLIDGDGYIQKNKDKIRIRITGTEQVLQFIKKFLNSNNTIIKEHRCENTYSFALENQISEDFLKKYNYINLPFALERKKDFVKDYFNSSAIE